MIKIVLNIINMTIFGTRRTSEIILSHGLNDSLVIVSSPLILIY
ncbi:hypothetical protein VCRA2123O444_70125 [Vibrio crassostreae]|nr:hypothetical protein VCRA2114O422_70125 [Vibrio crassostreae]CAK2188651.1 hypothetical protein VCRA2119O431_70126 [Vibrio crassostreae]CAK2362191.1 hypothetical protein VCRA2113O410_40126 [Vibrio crassostreae]CAK3120612.1 hypothetical protein VCRA2133O452_80125 [Vibrio crassostreae]CAK3949585.1 hypothetical protein VCRA2123O444_70125 [Vibrio crassostreae]